MKKSGFTLIELLAVIVVLAVIAIIAVPLITNVIDKAKQGALKDSGYGILESAEMYLAKNMSTGITDTMEFIYNNGTCLSGTEEINYKGQIDSGRIRIYSDSKIELCIESDNNSALKTVSSKEVVVSKGTCNYEEFNYGVTALVSKTVLDAKQKELDEANKKYNDLKALVDQTDAVSTDINIDKKAVTKEGLITGSNNGGELMYIGATYPGSLIYTATRGCDGIVAITSSNWASELSVSVKQNGASILSSTTRGAKSVNTTINVGDTFVFSYVSGTPNYSHMSMTIFCKN